MYEVATAAGVSVASVSRVVSGSRPVTPETAAAVEAAIARLGYRRNDIARSLRRRATQSVAMVVPHIANPYFPGVVQAVERALAAGAHELLLGDSQDEPATEVERVHALLGRQVDGLLLIPCDEHASRDVVAEAVTAVPVVQLDRTVAGTDTDAVTIDDAAGVRAVLAHLAATGRREVAFVGAEPTTSTARVRLATFRDTVGAAATVLLGDFSTGWGRTAARRLLAARTRPDAIVCANDLIAIGVIRELREAGRDLLGRVAVTGYDDIGFATLCDPPLTTIAQPVDALGETATRLLVERLADPGRPAQHAVLAPALVVRASTATGGTA